MALAGRRTGRRRRRWIALGILLTLLVLAVDAAVSSRSHGPAREQAALAYLDSVRPLVERSNQQGADLADVHTNATSLGRDGIGRRMDRVTREAGNVLAEARKLDPPANLRDANDLLVATFAIRAKAAGSARAALVAALGTDPPGPAVDGLVDAGKDMVASDRAYKLFLAAVPPKLGTPPPDSSWVSDEQGWSQPVLTSFVTTLRSSQVLSPVHDLAVALVLVDPASVGTDGETTLLSTAKNLKLQIVVTNNGNEAERHQTVSATISPSAIGPTETARDFVDLTPGQRRTVVLGTLRPPTNTVFTLTVRIDPATGETNTTDNEKSMTFLMR
jgi:hypothetical protein